MCGRELEPERYIRSSWGAKNKYCLPGDKDGCWAFNDTKPTEDVEPLTERQV